MAKQFLSSSEVIDALGGTMKAAGIFGVRSSAISNWRKRGFPGHVEARVWHECKRRRINYAPPAVQKALEQQQSKNTAASA